MYLYSLFDEYWNLYHKVTFDGVNKLILINDGVTEIDIQEDIYSAWKEWVLYDNNARYLKAIDTVGGEPTVAGQRLDVTYFLINGWKIKPFTGSYKLSIIGNIFDVNGENIIVPADIIDGEPNNININTNTSVIVRKVEVEGQNVDLSEIESQLSLQNIKLGEIDGKLVGIENILASPLNANLVGEQETVLNDIYDKLIDIWRVHGLDPNNNMTVGKNGRTVAGITQDFIKSGDSIIVKRNG